MSLSITETIDFEGTAAWRREKAEQFPDDTRNIRAAEELERLARELEALDEEGSEIARQIDDEEENLVELTERFEIDPEWGSLSEAVSDELRSIGFHGSYSTATEFLKWYLALVRKKRHDLIEELKDSTDNAYDLIEEAVPAPDLEQQVENDPRVKRARQAYEKARAEALAEARKTV